MNTPVPTTEKKRWLPGDKGRFPEEGYDYEVTVLSKPRERPDGKMLILRRGVENSHPFLVDPDEVTPID